MIHFSRQSRRRLELSVLSTGTLIEFPKWVYKEKVYRRALLDPGNAETGNRYPPVAPRTGIEKELWRI
ncbi:MAG TPA: hypothetical protein VMO00_06245, partial [Methylomirabilota bacterium]|nr:hypothetical protein [Methylomirabilota bacterium]